MISSATIKAVRIIGLPDGDVPTIFRDGNYQFIIYANDHVPPHVHIRAAGRRARVRLEPIELLDNDGFSQAQLRLIMRLAEQHRAELLHAWNEFHPLRGRQP